MKIAVMQPYFFPYLGYFCLIKHTDQFILLDEVQYIRHGWIDRNRILKPDVGWQYIKVPIRKHHRDILIKDVRIKNDQNWKNRILGQINHYKKKAPYFNEVKNLLEEVFSCDYDSIVKLNQVALTTICDYLKIDTNFQVFSKMDLAMDHPNAPDEWALYICKSITGVTEYLNLPGGIDLFDKNKYKSCSIKLGFININLGPYDQKREISEKGLSILDVLMFNDFNSINKMLDDFYIIN